MNLHRDETGKLPAYAWPGGYPIIYICDDGGVLCPACANGENGSEAYTDAYTPERGRDWHIAGSQVHWEGPAEYCAHCNATIDSAYGE